MENFQILHSIIKNLKKVFLIFLEVWVHEENIGVQKEFAF